MSLSPEPASETHTNSQAIRNFPTTRKNPNPAPLGLGSFALCSFVVAITYFKGQDSMTSPVVVSLALGYGGVMQILAGVWEMGLGNTFGATVFCSFGGFWFSFGLIAISHRIAPTDITDGMEVYLWAWAIFGTCCMLLSLRSTATVAVLFIIANIGFTLTAISQSLRIRNYHAAGAVRYAAGGFTLIAAFLAWYNMFAEMANAENFFSGVPLAQLPWSEEERKRKNSQSQA